MFLGNSDHEYCVVDEVSKLMDKGYDCYLEYPIFFMDGGKKRRLIIDIYAIKGNRKIIVEVGTLNRGTWRLRKLKELCPDAKIIHVHQWKNYGLGDGAIWWRNRLKKAQDKFIAELKAYKFDWKEFLKPEIREQLK